MLNWLPEAKRRTLCLMQTPKRATVRGYLHQGQRPHINFYDVRYTNAVLASTAAFLRQELRLYDNCQDLRTVRAFGGDGVEIDVLKAQGAWGDIPHDLKPRRRSERHFSPWTGWAAPPSDAKGCATARCRLPMRTGPGESLDESSDLDRTEERSTTPRHAPGPRPTTPQCATLALRLRTAAASSIDGMTGSAPLRTLCLFR